MKAAEKSTVILRSVADGSISAAVSEGMREMAPTRTGLSEPEIRRQRPSFRWSDLWKAPLHDFPIRDEILYQYLSLSPGMDVLEIGPGSGFTAFRLAREVRGLTLVDTVAEVVAELKKALKDHRNLTVVQADATGPDLSRHWEQGFDAVFALDVFEYLVDPAACLVNLADLLRPGGQLLLTYPNVPPPLGDGVTYFPRREELEQLLNQAGFRKWEIFAVRLRPGATAIYRVLHEWPLRLYRALRGGDRDARPQSYEGTWAFQHRQRLFRYRVPLHLFWLALERTMRLGGDVFRAESIADGILRRQLVIRAWK